MNSEEKLMKPHPRATTEMNGDDYVRLDLRD